MKKQKKQKIDAFHWHEAIHTVSILEDIFDRQLLQHPVIERDAYLKGLADDAHRAIYELYQAIARIAPHMQPAPPSPSEEKTHEPS